MKRVTQRLEFCFYILGFFFIQKIWVITEHAVKRTSFYVSRTEKRYLDGVVLATPSNYHFSAVECDYMTGRHIFTHLQSIDQFSKCYRTQRGTCTI